LVDAEYRASNQRAVNLYSTPDAVAHRRILGAKYSTRRSSPSLTKGMHTESFCARVVWRKQSKMVRTRTTTEIG